jgi:hypothetical protein
MAKKLNTMAAGLLLLSLTMGVAGSAAAEITSDSGQKTDKTIRISAATALGGVYMSHSVGLGLLGNPVHEQNYLRMLAKAYAPDSEQAWNEAIEARKQVEAQFPKMAVALRAPSIPQDGSTVSNEAFHIITEKPLNGEDVTKELQVGDKKVHVTFIKKDQATKVQNHPADRLQPDVTMKGMPPVMLEVSPQAKLQGDFSKAIDAGDAAAVKALLPQMLEAYKEATDKISKSIEQQKKWQAESGQVGLDEAAISTEAKPSTPATK